MFSGFTYAHRRIASVGCIFVESDHICHLGIFPKELNGTH